MKGKVVDTSKEDEGRLRAGGGIGKRKKAAEAENPTAPPVATMKGKALDNSDEAAATSDKRPKRPPSAFFLFLSQSCQEYNQLQPGSKEKLDVEQKAGLKWASMSAQDKQPYVDQAGQKKQAYEEALADFEKSRAPAGHYSVSLKVETKQGIGA